MLKNKAASQLLPSAGNILNKKVYSKACKCKEKGFDKEAGNDLEGPPGQLSPCQSRDSRTKKHDVINKEKGDGKGLSVFPLKTGPLFLPVL